MGSSKIHFFIYLSICYFTTFFIYVCVWNTYSSTLMEARELFSTVILSLHCGVSGYLILVTGLVARAFIH